MRYNPPTATIFYLVELSNPTEIEIVQRGKQGKKSNRVMWECGEIAVNQQFQFTKRKFFN